MGDAQRAHAIGEDANGPIVGNPATGGARVFDEFQSKSFAFPHALGNDPRFTPSELLKLAERIPRYPGFVFWQNGRVAVGDGWGEQTSKRLTLEETIDGIAENDSLVILKHAEQDPAYGPILRDILNSVYSYAPQAVRDDIVIGEALVFLNSPNRKTVYHLDLEASCLLQVSGEKTIFVFDRSGNLVSDTELEDHCAGNHSAAVYRPETQSEASEYRLTPGLAVHFPSTIPHWVQNGPDVSVSININFDLRSVHHRLRSVHRMNRSLRRIGLTPTPPGRAPSLDGAKAAIQNGLESARATAKTMIGRNPGASYPHWRPPAAHR